MNTPTAADRALALNIHLLHSRPHTSHTTDSEAAAQLIAAHTAQAVAEATQGIGRDLVDSRKLAQEREDKLRAELSDLRAQLAAAQQTIYKMLDKLGYANDQQESFCVGACIDRMNELTSARADSERLQSALERVSGWFYAVEVGMETTTMQQEADAIDSARAAMRKEDTP